MSKHKKLTTRQAEPAMVRGVAIAVALLASFGVTWAADMTPEQQLLIAGALTAIAPLLQGAWTRLAVTANEKVLLRTTTDGKVVAGDAAVLSTGTEMQLTPTPAGSPVVQAVAVRSELVDEVAA